MSRFANWLSGYEKQRRQEGGPPECKACPALAQAHREMDYSGWLSERLDKSEKESVALYETIRRLRLEQKKTDSSGGRVSANEAHKTSTPKKEGAEMTPLDYPGMLQDAYHKLEVQRKINKLLYAEVRLQDLYKRATDSGDFPDSRRLYCRLTALRRERARLESAIAGR